MGGSGSLISIDQVVPRNTEHGFDWLLLPSRCLHDRVNQRLNRNAERRRQARQDVDARPRTPGLPPMDTRLGNRPEPLGQLC